TTTRSATRFRPAAAGSAEPAGSEPVQRGAVEPVVRQAPGDQFGEGLGVVLQRRAPAGRTELTLVLAHQPQSAGPVPQLPDRKGEVLAIVLPDPPAVPAGIDHELLDHRWRQV